MIKRLKYYQDYLSFISMRSNLSVTMNNRIQILKKLTDIEVIDNVPLINANDEPIKISESFITNHSHINEKIVGNILELSDFRILFIGFPLELYSILGEQRQSEILNYKSVSKITTEDISIRVPVATAKRSPFFKRINHLAARNAKYFHYVARSIEVVQCSSGLNYGVIRANNID
ncbi:hypothetical protein [Salegentibacter sp. F14]